MKFSYDHANIFMTCWAGDIYAIWVIYLAGGELIKALWQATES